MKKESNILIFVSLFLIALISVSKAEIFDFYEDTIIQDGDSYPYPDDIHVYNTSPNTTTVKMTGGDVDEIFMHDASRLNVSNGYIAWVYGQDESNIEITGGNISRLLAHDSSIFNIRGGDFGVPGRFNTLLIASGSGIFNIFGYDFNYTPLGGDLG